MAIHLLTDTSIVPVVVNGVTFFEVWVQRAAFGRNVRWWEVWGKKGWTKVHHEPGTFVLSSVHYRWQWMAHLRLWWESSNENRRWRRDG